MAGPVLMLKVAPYVSPWPIVRHFVGHDLGQSIDPSALSVIERKAWPADGDLTTRKTGPRALRYEFEVRHLERLPLRMSYAQQAEHVRELMSTAPLRQNGALICDATGVGVAVIELYRRAGLSPIALTITGGEGFSVDSGAWRVSKLALTSRLQAMLHSGSVKIAAKLKERAALTAELADFRVSYTDSGSATFGARSGRHDDLVLATAIGLFVAYETVRTSARVHEIPWG